MRKLLALISFIIFFQSCDDGDIITVNIDFDDEFYACGETVFYKTKTDPTESLSLYINDDEIINDLFELQYVSDESLLVELVNGGSLEGSSSNFKYRTYSSDDVSDAFCNDIPPSDLGINQDYTSSCNYIFTITLIEDDGDGVPAEEEDRNGNGDLYDDDTDGDGIPNFLDDDDDGDNVPTSTELYAEDPYNYNDEELTEYTDTDGDGTPNYLDSDDDGDGTLTINEDSNQNLNPADASDRSEVIIDGSTVLIYNYLIEDVDDFYEINEYRLHQTDLEYHIQLEIYNVSFPNLQQDYFDFGILQGTTVVPITYEREFLPPFN